MQLRLMTLCVLLSGILAAQSTSISGVVSDATSGAAVAGIKVYAIRLAPEKFTTSTVVSAADGSFLLSLPPGTYKLCGQGTATHVTNCLWLDAGDAVVVALNQRVTGRVLRMMRGSILTVRVNDAGGNMKAKNGLPGGQVFVAVGDGKGNAFAVFPVRSDSAGDDYELFVPVGMPLQMMVKGLGVSVVDEARKAVPSTGASEAFTHVESPPPGQKNKSFVFHVTGKV